MKGIITKYFDKKGFGFIKDQDENLRFFHISSVIERNKFLSNLPEYIYEESGNEICNKVVIFKAMENEKGLQAIDIILTDKMFNDQNKKTTY